MDDLRVADAMDAIWTLLRRSNKYIDETTPWILAKDEALMPRLGTVLYNLLESIRMSAVMLQPFMPETAEKIFEQLNTQVTDWDSLGNFDGIHAGDKVGEGVALFARLDEKKTLDMIEEKMQAKQPKKSLKNLNNLKKLKRFQRLLLMILQRYSLQ